MMVSETIHQTESVDEARCRVTTRDATGDECVYEIDIAPERLNGACLLEGKRVDADAPDEPAGGGVPKPVFDEARDHFRDRGFEVGD